MGHMYKLNLKARTGSETSMPSMSTSTLNVQPLSGWYNFAILPGVVTTETATSIVLESPFFREPMSLLEPFEAEPVDMDDFIRNIDNLEPIDWERVCCTWRGDALTVITRIMRALICTEHDLIYDDEEYTAVDKWCHTLLGWPLEDEVCWPIPVRLAALDHIMDLEDTVLLSEYLEMLIAEYGLIEPYSSTVREVVGGLLRAR